MSHIDQINFLIIIFGIFTSIAILLFLLTGGEKSDRLNRLFIRLIIFNLVTLISVLVSGYFQIQGKAAAFRITIFINFAAVNFLVPLLADYIHALIARSRKISRFFPNAIYIGYLIWFISLAASQFNGLYYIIGENCTLIYSGHFWLSQLYGAVSLLYITAVIAWYRKSLDFSDILYLLFYPFASVIAVIVQIVLSGEFGIIYLTNTFFALFCYGGIQVRQTKQAVRLTQITLSSLKNIMDGINTSIYVIEPGTCKLLFVNKWLKAFYGRENDDFSGEFCYKAFRGFDEMCSFCPCVRLADNPEQTIEWEEFFRPHGIYVRHLFCYIDWPDGEKAVLHYGIDTTEIHEKMDLLVKLEKQERELAENRMSIMLSQIQPHFLYNALSAMQDLCVEDPVAAKQMIIDFSHYLRGNLNSLELSRPIPFEQELKHVETYLAIEKKRFEEKLNIKYEIHARDFVLPALSLQLVAENAVRYGITKRPGGGTVSISSQETESAYIITVEDDGVGFDPGKAFEDDGRSHVGIKNVSSRLEAMCGGSLDIQSRPGTGTAAIISIPKAV